jgi:hypothetical protein
MDARMSPTRRLVLNFVVTVAAVVVALVGYDWFKSRDRKKSIDDAYLTQAIAIAGRSNLRDAPTGPARRPASRTSRSGCRSARMLPERTATEILNRGHGRTRPE